MTSPVTQEQDIADYLSEHPEFFERFPDALCQLRLRHSSGQAVSLIEKQVTSLRERNTELRNKLNQLLQTARENDRLFEQSKRLILALLECEEFGDFVDALYYGFDKEFNVSATRLIIFGGDYPSVNVRASDLDEARLYLGRKLDSHRAVCGGMAPEQLAYLFDKERCNVGSAAYVSLNYNRPMGVLAIGNADPEHFQSGMDTLFLTHIGEVLNRVLPQYLRHGKRASGAEVGLSSQIHQSE